jgi:RNA recognition motif-containing protein
MISFSSSGLVSLCRQPIEVGGFFIPAGSRSKETGMEVKLYVGNLSYATTEDDLRTLFAQAGAVASVAVIKDRDTGYSKGFAFIEMGSQAEAAKAIQMFNGYSLDSRDLKVNAARPREESNRYGSGGGDRQRRY